MAVAVARTGGTAAVRLGGAAAYARVAGERRAASRGAVAPFSGSCSCPETKGRWRSTPVPEQVKGAACGGESIRVGGSGAVVVVVEMAAESRDASVERKREIAVNYWRRDPDEKENDSTLLEGLECKYSIEDLADFLISTVQILVAQYGRVLRFCQMVQ
ncbi:hypothetical protein ACP70R_013418 [Stipagrostis hirtigluma subsp. patula]